VSFFALKSYPASEKRVHEEKEGGAERDGSPSRRHDMQALKDRIAAEWRDEDGYWIELKSGWQDNFNPGCHTITEDTRKEARYKLRASVPCDCRECRTPKDPPVFHGAEPPESGPIRNKAAGCAPYEPLRGRPLDAKARHSAAMPTAPTHLELRCACWDDMPWSPHCRDCGPQ
jgi:hypothetical protein